MSNKDVKRRKKKQEKQKLEQARLLKKAAFEKKLQEKLGTELVGYWQVPVDGYTAADVLNRSIWYGDWNPKDSPKGERRFIISMYLYSSADKQKDRQLDLTDLEMTCEFDDIYSAVYDHVREIEKENPHLKIDGYRSFCRVRT